MTSKERIYKILNFQTPDRIGIHDTFHDSTIEGWRRDGLPTNLSPEDYFNFDFEVFDIKEVLSNELPGTQNSEKFVCLSFCEPFQRLCNIFGREDTLRKIALYPKKFQADLIQQTDSVLNSLQSALQKGLTFDGVWGWGDLAYKGGLFFSPSFYKRLLFPLHRKIFRFLDSQGLFILFHSDGMIYDLIPYLLDAGVKAFHPLEEDSGMDIYKLFKSYKDEMVFMGCINIARLIREKDCLRILKEKIDRLKDNSFYIYHSGYPIMPDISFKDYKRMIKTVKECGTY